MQPKDGEGVGCSRRAVYRLPHPGDGLSRREDLAFQVIGELGERSLVDPAFYRPCLDIPELRLGDRQIALRRSGDAIFELENLDLRDFVPQ
jgi:hypothetical protein